MNAIEVRSLSKRYGALTALDALSLDVKEGELFGLLGVNGAGKSTLIKILCGLIRPTSGEAAVAGFSLATELDKIKAAVDVSPQNTSVAPNLTVRENLSFFAGIYGVPRADVPNKVREVAELFSLTDVLDKRAKTLSGGYARRVSIAIALISSPKILFLDEPTLGLDVLARRELWRVIGKLKGRITILLTSHYLEEIEALCDRVAVLCRGKLLAVGTVPELEQATGTASLENAFVTLAEKEEN